MHWNQLYLLTFYLSGYVHCAISVSMCDLLYYLYWGSYLINKAVCFTHYIFLLHSLFCVCGLCVCLFVRLRARVCVCVVSLYLSFSPPSCLPFSFFLHAHAHRGTFAFLCYMTIAADGLARLYWPQPQSVSRPTLSYTQHLLLVKLAANLFWNANTWVILISKNALHVNEL